MELEPPEIEARQMSVAARRALAFQHLDEAEMGWFHLRAVLVAGVGFFTDAYDIFVISQALPMIYQVYYSSLISGSFPPSATLSNSSIPRTPQNTRVDFINSYPDGVHVDAWLKASTNWGNLVGQLIFGVLGDKLGRKKMYGVELIIMIVCTVCSAFSSSMAHGASILVVLSIWRFLLGVGVGGDYPASAVITSEFANVRYRGMMIAAVFAMQGIGILMGAIVYVSCLAALKDSIQQDFTYLDYVWRITLGIGVIPALFAVYFRLTVPETPRFTADVMGATDKAVDDIERILALNDMGTVLTSWGTEQEAKAVEVVKKNSIQEFREYFGRWKNMKVLIGTTYCWFALDVAWYGLALNQSTVLNLINFNGPKKISVDVTVAGVTTKSLVTPPIEIWNVFFQNAVGNIIIGLAGTVPGYWFAVALIEKMGRKPIQMMGFAIITICLAVLAACWSSLSTQQVPFLIVFTIAQFFFQFGPNTTTFVIPGEAFPTRFRSSCHGLSAASGKLGAVIGIQVVGPYFSSNTVMVLSVFAFVMFTGLLATFLLPETAGKSLGELSSEDHVGIALKDVTSYGEVLLVFDEDKWIVADGDVVL
ncbi:major facilitator superfamily domain-containing protein [Chytriomyces sp. MP71]|nr:major facilitator superfamily domain-containing protein [Chytriomyces sp. MP71]